MPAPAIVRRATAQLVRPATYLRGVYLLLGGVVAIPYVGLIIIFVMAMGRSSGSDLVVFVLLAVVTAAVAIAVPLVPAARTLEIVAARAFLGVALPDPEPETQRSWDARRRGGLWYLITLVLGSAVVLAVLYGVPTGLGLIAIPLSGTRSVTLALISTWTWEAQNGWLALLCGIAGVGVLVLTVYSMVLGGALLVRWAPALLGPTQADRVAQLQRRERQLAASNELARELHDSIGHALTAVTMQAGAAGRVLDRDPEFARIALSRIEETSRAALEELDDVLGILRRGDGARSRLSSRTLEDVPTLTVGHDVRLTSTGDATAVPPSVSREAYRIVQESLTNAARHGDGGPVTLSVDVAAGRLRIRVENGIGAASEHSGGRGVVGMRERVLILGGTLEAAPTNGRWVVDATLPWGEDGS